MARRSLILLAASGLIAAGSATAPPVSASSPPAHSVTVPAPGQTTTVTWTGTVPPGVTATGDCSINPVTDTHTVNLTVPAGAYATRIVKAVFRIDWKTASGQADDTVDEAIQVDGPSGTVGASDSSGTTTESVMAFNPAAGAYTVIACGATNPAPTAYTGTLTMVTEQVSPLTATSQYTAGTVVDPILFGGEPGINFDPTVAVGGRSFIDWPLGSQQIGVLFRSEDGGLSYTKRYGDATALAAGGPTCIGRQVPTCLGGGGGDTDVHVTRGNGRVYFSSQEALVAQLIGSSDDHGDTFPADHTSPLVSSNCTGVDRQWITSWADTGTAFFAYHIPLVGECINRNDQGGLATGWSLSGPPKVQGVNQSGAFVADNTGGATNHNLYLAFINSGGYAVAVSRDGNATYVVHNIPGANAVRSFTKLQIDTAGNLYATWTDSSDQKTYLATSKAADPANLVAPASKWSTPIVISPGALRVTIFPDVVAGSPGRMAVAYYGTTAQAATPDDVKPGDGGWLPYVSTSLNALCQWDATPCAAPTFAISKVAHRVNQDDNICTSGTACAATMGNRNLADYFDLSLDSEGHLGFVWGDAYNATKQPFVKVARQASGPSLFAGKPDAKETPRTNGFRDAAGDARYPIAGASIRTATNHPALDLLGTTIGLKDAATLEVSMRVADLTKLAEAVPGGGTSVDGASALTQAKYVTRWDFGANSFYVGASVAAGSATPTYFAGTVSQAEAVLSASTATTKGNTYKSLAPATGRIDGDRIIVDVATKDVGGIGLGGQIFSVGSYSLVGPPDAAVVLFTLPLTVDSTPTFDATLAAVPGSVAETLPGGAPPGGGGKVQVLGSETRAIAATGATTPLLPITGAGIAVLAGAASVIRRRVRRTRHPR